MSIVYTNDNLRKRVLSYGIPLSSILLITADPMLRASAMLMFPSLSCAEPSIIPYLCAHYSRLPITDPDHSNAHELEVFEKKREIEKNFDSHDSFIIDSELHATLYNNCHEKAAEILKLLDNAHKLGFINTNYDKAHLTKLLTNRWNECTYMTAADKYADYGIVAFSCHNNRENKSVCSVTSWFINQEDLSRKISNSVPDPRNSNTSGDGSIQILLKGNNNLHYIEDYLIGGAVTTEYDDPYNFHDSPLPSMLYSSRFHIVIYSLIQEDYSAWKENSEQMLSALFDTLESLCSSTLGNPTIILLLGYESGSSVTQLPDSQLAELHSEINPIICDFASEQPRIRIINFTDYIEGPDDFNGSVSAFSTRVYSDIVEQIVVYINDKVDEILRSQHS